MASSRPPPPPPGFPVKTSIFRRSINGVATDFSFSIYSDRALLFVTQTGSVGTVISASQERMATAAAACDDPLDVPAPPATSSEGIHATSPGEAAAIGVSHHEATGGGTATEETSSSSSSATYATAVLLGRRDEPALQICARQVVERLHRQRELQQQQQQGRGSLLSGGGGAAAPPSSSSSGAPPPPVLVCLALRNHSMATIKGVIDAVQEAKPWAAATKG